MPRPEGNLYTSEHVLQKAMKQPLFGRCTELECSLAKDASGLPEDLPAWCKGYDSEVTAMPEIQALGA
jgi:hypothetical protein